MDAVVDQSQALSNCGAVLVDARELSVLTVDIVCKMCLDEQCYYLNSVGESLRD